MAVMDELVEKAEEISDQQVADVQAVHVGIRGQYDLFIAESFEIVLDIEAAHEVVHFVVFVHDVALEIPDVERFAFKNENSLGIDIPATDDGPADGLALRQKDHETLA